MNISRKTRTQSSRSMLTGGALVLSIATSVFAQEKPFIQPGTGQPPAPPAPPKAAPSADVAKTPAPAAPAPSAMEQFFSAKIPEAIAKGKFSLNARLRYEYVDQDGTPAITDPSHAPTIRTRFGFTSAPLYGFQGMLEAENITLIGSRHNYNAAGTSGEPEKPIVADPATTELNQAWLSYTYTNLATLKGGRQRIALDNHRFVGDVGWRQNMQTFDAVSAEFKPIKELSLYYGYIWDVHRIFGDVSGLGAANRDFNSRSHLINVSYVPCSYGRFVGYSYLLDLENRGGTAQSCATYGGYFAGSANATDKISLDYRAEFAYQTDYADNPQEYGAEYYNVELGATMKPFSLGAGYEVLGTDSNGAGAGSVGFKTPLATGHAFNGWGDLFLATPAKGLQDIYAYAQVVLPAQVPLRAVYHKFDADSGSGDYGYEIDLQASKKFGKNWTALAKYAYYNGKDTPIAVDVQKFWAQVEFNF